MIVSLLDGLDASDNGSALREQVYSEAAGAAFTGGTDTTVSAIGSFILAMLLYPDEQRKIQEELDRVVGPDRLPDFADEASLPYASAAVKEVLRWQPVTPLGVPHRLMADDEYEGYHMPAGSVVIANEWAMLHDPSRFADHAEFKPARFLGAQRTLDGHNVADAEAGFGHGRRICPGRHLALASIFITVVSLLSVFSLEKPKDADGSAVEPSMEYTSGLVVHPHPFQCVFKPRSNAAESLIRSAVLDWD